MHWANIRNDEIKAVPVFMFNEEKLVLNNRMFDEEKCVFEASSDLLLSFGDTNLHSFINLP